MQKLRAGQSKKSSANHVSLSQLNYKKSLIALHWKKTKLVGLRSQVKTKPVSSVYLDRPINSMNKHPTREKANCA